MAGSLMLISGDTKGQAAHASAGLANAERTRDGYRLASATFACAHAASTAGDWEGARGFLQRGLAIAPHDPRHIATTALLELELGNFEEAGEYVDRLVQLMDMAQTGDVALSYPIVADVLPYAALVTGTSERLEIGERAARTVLSSPDRATPLVIGEAYQGLALIAMLRGDVALAAEQYDALLPLKGTFPPGLHQTDHVLGLLAATMGKLDDAVVHFDDALAFLKEGFRPSYAWAAFDCARALVQRDATGDRERAAELLDESLATTRELGMRPLMERALALKMELQGIDTSTIQTSIDAVAAYVQTERPDLRPHAAPDGTVTILFTDIEGSTPLNERLGDQRWMVLLREHNALVREQVRANEGFEVKTEGDGFMVAFSSARRGLQCSTAIQRAFAERNAKAEEPISVRAGLHTGEAVQEAGDFYGKHVTLASRIASEARGGEILVSSLLKELTESAGDIAFDGGREVELKGLTGAQRVFAVRWE